MQYILIMVSLPTTPTSSSPPTVPYGIYSLENRHLTNNNNIYTIREKQIKFEWNKTNK